MRVAVYALKAGAGFGNKRAHHIAKAFSEGLRRQGVEHALLTDFSAGVVADVAVAYGWIHEPIFTAYREKGAHYAYWDLGYWNRRPEGKSHEGSHRLAIDDWDTVTNMRVGCPSDRFDALGLQFGTPNPSRRDILIAGMSSKAAGTHGFGAEEWENRMLAWVRALAPEVRIVMRPKPNKRTAAQAPISEALTTAKILITHHSNCALDALLAGVPVYAVKGIGRTASPINGLTRGFIDNPPQPSMGVRRELLYCAAYAQWTPEEMRRGEAWQAIKEILRCA